MSDRREHPLNRHLFIADNINLLRSLDNETIDLIVTDPPFGKGRTFVSGKLKPELSPEERSWELEQMAGWGVTDRRTAREAEVEWPDQDGRACYDDIWRWQDVHVKFGEQLERSHPTEAALINTARAVHSDGLAAYLSYMAVRLLEMHRVLKPAGALYLQCDYTANSYLRMLLDTVFGKDNLRGAIIWQRASGRGKGSQHARKTFGADTDTILFYSKTADVRLIGGGRPLTTLWADIPNLTGSREGAGYPSQKPAALAERIILASSQPGDVVLDPFAGGAYVPVAAEGLGRQWIACDISPRAMTVMRRQFNKFRYAADGGGSVLVKQGETTPAALLADAAVSILGPGQLPERTDRDPEPEPPPPPLESEEPEYGGQMFQRREMLEMLLRKSGWMAWCCGYAVRRPSGDIVEAADSFHLDHIDPRWAEGSEYITNRAPLCASCNILRGNRPITLRQLREEIIEQGRLLVDSPSDLPDLGEMRQAAADLHARRFAEMNRRGT